MNQDEIIKNSISQRFNNLQPEIQAVIMDPSYDVNIVAISKKYNLTTDQLKDLEMDTTFILLGQIHPDDYPIDLLEDLSLPQETITKIVTDVETQILKNVRAMIVKNFEDDEKEETDARVTENATPETTTPILPIDSRFNILPKEVQDAVVLSDYQKKIYDIGTEYKLPINKMATLEEITVKFITASISPTQYEGELALATDLPAEKVSEIATKVNEQILKKIRAQMQSGGAPQISEDEVPLPPYAMPIYSNEVKRSESDIYKDSGIEITKNEEPGIQKIEKIEISNKEDNILNKSGINIIEGLRHPDNIISNKLSGITSNINTTTDYSIPKINKEPAPTVQAPVAPNIRDPYHEAIE